MIEIRGQNSTLSFVKNSKTPKMINSFSLNTHNTNNNYLNNEEPFLDFTKAIIGLFNIENFQLIFYIKSSCFLGIYNNCKIYRIQKLGIHFLNGTTTEINKKANLMKEFFESQFFFYCNYEDLLHNNNIKNKSNIESNTIIKNINNNSKNLTIDEFIWNLNARNSFLKYSNNKSLIVNVYCGYCSLDFDSNFKLVSFISKNRIGSRYLCRGIDIDGNCCMTVKTVFSIQDLDINNTKKPDINNKQDLEIEVFRGSIPLFWGQTDDLKKDVYICDENLKKLENENLLTEKNSEVFLKNLEKIKALSDNFLNKKKIIVLNLLGTRKHERLLSDNYKTLCTKNNIVYYDFDLNKYQFDYTQLKLLFDDKLKEIFDEHGNDIIFRVNCLDCLDRTNVSEMFIVEFILNNIVKYEFTNNKETFMKKFKTSWAENGNFLSVLYSGTAAHKNELTSTGKRSIQGILGDFVITATRAVHGNLTDYQKNEIFKLIIG